MLDAIRGIDGYLIKGGIVGLNGGVASVGTVGVGVGWLVINYICGVLVLLLFGWFISGSKERS